MSPKEVARENVEKYIGDCDCEDADEVFENVYVLAMDALIDADLCDHQWERESIATQMATEYSLI